MYKFKEQKKVLVEKFLKLKEKNDFPLLVLLGVALAIICFLLVYLNFKSGTTRSKNYAAKITPYPTEDLREWNKLKDKKKILFELKNGKIEAVSNFDPITSPDIVFTPGFSENEIIYRDSKRKSVISLDLKTNKTKVIYSEILLSIGINIYWFSTS